MLNSVFSTDSINLSICPTVLANPLPLPPIVLVASAGMSDGMLPNNLAVDPKPNGKSKALVFSVFSKYGEPKDNKAVSKALPATDAKDGSSRNEPTGLD